MTSPITILVACFAPSLAWLGYFGLRKKIDPEPLHLMLLVFAGGILAGPLSLVLFKLIETVPFYSYMDIIDDIGETKKLAYCMGAIAPIEEISKFLVFWFFVQRKHIEFKHPVDGLIYAAAASLGFATIENWYFMVAVDETVWSRAITLPFNHVLFASFWGVALGINRCKGSSSRLVVVGLLLAIVFHGLYDYILFSDLVPNLSVTPLILVLWLWLTLATRDLLTLPLDVPAQA